MAERGVRFADGSLPGPPPPKQWVVPSFSAFKVPPPPPRNNNSPSLSKQNVPPPSPPKTMTGSSSDARQQPESEPRALSTPQKGAGLPTEIQTRGGSDPEQEGISQSASQSATALLSPISAMTEVTHHSPVGPQRQETPKEAVEVESPPPTDVSFDTLATIDMLNFEFVRKCSNPIDLGRIIRVLSDRNRAKSAPTQLLQAARQRLQAVQGKKAPPPPPRNQKSVQKEKNKPAVRSNPTKKVVPPPPPPRSNERIYVADESEENKEHQTTQEVTNQPPVQPPPILPVVSSDEEENKLIRDDEMSDDEEENVKSPGKILTESTANISRITLGNTTLDSIEHSKNSLNLSYSPPSVLRGLDLVDTPSRKGLETSGLLSESRYSRLGTISEVSTSAAITPTSSYQERLSAEVEKITDNAVSIEKQRANDQAKFIQKLESLQRAKMQADELVRTLEAKVSSESGEKEAAFKELQIVQESYHTVSQTLQDTRSQLQTQERETNHLEKRLRGKIAELQRALAEEEDHHRQEIADEKRLREQSEEDLTSQRERSVQLNLLLRQTKENLERIKKTQNTFRSELLKAFGMKEQEFKNVPQDEFIRRISERVRNIRTENLKLAESLKQAQVAPHEIVAERDQLRSRIREVLQANRTLQEENATLGAKIEELSEEVFSSRTLIDKLLKTSHETQASDWERKESQYKAAIRNYQQQIRKQESTVSLDLYKAAMDDSKKTQLKLQNATRKILDLESKMLSLEEIEGEVAKETAKTPKRMKAREAVPFMSPTDNLEKGLLSQDYDYQQVPSLPAKLSAKKPKTPLSQMKSALDLRMGCPTSLTKKSCKTRSYCSPIEKMKFSRIVEPEDSARPVEHRTGTEARQHREDLTGMTIVFEKPVGGLPSPQKEVAMTNQEWVDCYTEKLLKSAEKKKALSRYNTTKAFLSPKGKGTTKRDEVDNSATPANTSKETKENQETLLFSPKSASKTLRMRKARELGGVKGLKSQLNKIRSPLGKPQRVALGAKPINIY